MHPILFDFGDIKIPSWHVLYVLGAILAYFYLINIRRKHLTNLNEDALIRLFAVCYIAGYFGARLLSIFIEQDELWRNNPKEILALLFTLGPMTFYGGLLAAILSGLAYSKAAKLSIPDVFDLSLPAGLLALGVGRIGCFLNGDDYGKAVSIEMNTQVPWWSVTFPSLQDGINRYPVQLIESLCAMFIVMVVTAWFSKLRANLRPGAVGLLSLAFYANCRFFLEFLRGDFRGFVFGTWLSTSQFISIVILLCCAISIPYWIGSGSDSRASSK